MRRAIGFAAVATLAVGCGAQTHGDAPQTAGTAARTAAGQTSSESRRAPAARPPWPLPGDLLIADRNNDRILIVSPGKRALWQDTALRGPDDAFFTPGYRSIITNEEFNDTITEVSVATKQPVWRYGHDAAAGSSPGYLNTPDDAYRLPNGRTTVADIRNCRIVQLARSGRVARILGGSCVHDPPRGFASPNGDTPLPDGGLLVTEIGGWIDRIKPDGRLAWAVRSPVSYPSDAQLLPNGRILVAGFTNPGKVVELTRAGRVTWSFGDAAGPNRLNKPSLAVRLSNGVIAVTDDWNDRVILVDPRTKRIVWQYGHLGVPSSAPGYLSKPDGLDLLPSSSAQALGFAGPAASRAPLARRAVPRAPLAVVRIGALPQATSRAAAVALPGGHLLVLGGLVAGSSSAQVLTGPPESLRAVGTLPVATHDAAAVLLGRSAYLLGGGEAVSTDAVVRVDPGSGATRPVGKLVEPLSDLGAATLARAAYLVGGYTGTRWATAVLRFRPGWAQTVVARLPVGVRYAGVAALGGKLYVAGGVSTSGPTSAVYAVDVRTGRVDRVATLPAPTAHAPLAVLDGALYLVGPGRAVLRIDPKTGAVARAATLPRALPDAAAVTRGREIVVVGGAGSDAVYALRPTR